MTQSGQHQGNGPTHICFIIDDQDPHNRAYRVGYHEAGAISTSFLLVAKNELGYDAMLEVASLEFSISAMEIINPPTWAQPKGYNNGIKTGAGHLVFIAGQVAWDEDQQIVGQGNFVKQFDQALANVLAVLKQAGGRPEHLVKLTIFVTDKEVYRGQQKEIGQAYRLRMGKHFPAMTLVEVKNLLEVDALIEIEGMAVIESRSQSQSRERNRR